MSDDNYCTRHFCNKTWMITSSFCPKCEEERHGGAGVVPPQPDFFWAELSTEIDEILGEEKTVPLGSDPTDPQGFQIIKPSAKCQIDTLDLGDCDIVW